MSRGGQVGPIRGPTAKETTGFRFYQQLIATSRPKQERHWDELETLNSIKQPSATSLASGHIESDVARGV
jgi:hypothetical protein